MFQKLFLREYPWLALGFVVVNGAPSSSEAVESPLKTLSCQFNLDPNLPPWVVNIYKTLREDMKTFSIGHPDLDNAINATIQYQLKLIKPTQNPSTDVTGNNPDSDSLWQRVLKEAIENNTKPNTKWHSRQTQFLKLVISMNPSTPSTTARTSASSTSAAPNAPGNTPIPEPVDFVVVETPREIPQASTGELTESKPKQTPLEFFQHRFKNLILNWASNFNGGNKQFWLSLSKHYPNLGEAMEAFANRKVPLNLIVDDFLTEYFSPEKKNLRTGKIEKNPIYFGFSKRAGNVASIPEPFATIRFELQNQYFLMEVNRHLAILKNLHQFTQKYDNEGKGEPLFKTVVISIKTPITESQYKIIMDLKLELDLPFEIEFLNRPTE